MNFNQTGSTLNYLIPNNPQEFTPIFKELSNLNILERLWASWYLYFNNDILSTGLLFFLTHELTYFGRCLPWFIIDNVAWFRKYKIQDTKLPSNKEQWECFKKVLKSHFLIESLPIWLFHPLCQQLNIIFDVPFPSWKIQCFQIAIFFFLEDLWHYTFHRLFHWNWFYKYIHKVHHKYAAPFGLTAEYAHPVEVMALGVGTVGFPILYAYLSTIYDIPPLHLFTINTWIILRLFQAIDSHSGYDFPWSLHNFLPIWAGAKHHDEHHHYFIGNYASSFIMWDKFFKTELSRLNEYQVIGRRLPTDSVPEPKLFRMRIFAPNTVVAKSRYWYFLQKLHKVKKTSGEIVALNVISETKPTKVKTFGIWIRYESRSGIHNMYKEYRDVTRVGAVETMYQDLAARHRARFRNIHILKVVELEKSDDVKRQYVKQFLAKDLKFPLPHRVQKSKKLFQAHAPTTFY
ncbi:unnamed protein product [Candida verbasci]|uniref:Fatty acid hydroxylase domain-containing protein n=1 Tax=Candida verbasci TaxID=1227364 RepID=A0A9W4TZP0_9ASCO|nr:unnamed protein product [Candida verbasci]